MERLEADSLDDLYEEIADLRGRAARDAQQTRWDRTQRSVEFSPIMLVFHEEDVDYARIEQTDAWAKHERLCADYNRQQQLESELKALQAKRASEQRERAEYDRLAKKFGDRS